MKMEFENFIGIAPNVITDDLCSTFVKWFDAASENNLTLSSYEQSEMRGINRKDESVVVPSGLPEHMFPTKFSEELWNSLNNSIGTYHTEYDIGVNLTSYSYKVHRVHTSGGYVGSAIVSGDKSPHSHSGIRYPKYRNKASLCGVNKSRNCAYHSFRGLSR